VSRPNVSFNSDVITKAIKHVLGEKADLDEERVREVSHSLVLAQPSIRMPTTAWLEVLWTTSEDERTYAMRELHPRLSDDQLTLDAVEIAVKLARASRSFPNFCNKCWGTDIDKPCTKCGRLGCREDRRNDLVILASAVVAEGVDTIYTFDGGMLHLAGHELLGTLRVVRPTPPAQGVLPNVDIPSAPVAVAPPRPRRK
jgi:hypothetical protein